MKKIAIEEHFRTEYYVKYLQSRKQYPRMESTMNKKGQDAWLIWYSAEESQQWFNMRFVNKLCDTGEVRLNEMDEAGIDMTCPQ